MKCQSNAKLAETNLAVVGLNLKLRSFGWVLPTIKTVNTCLEP